MADYTNLRTVFGIPTAVTDDQIQQALENAGYAGRTYGSSVRGRTYFDDEIEQILENYKIKKSQPS